MATKKRVSKATKLFKEFLKIFGLYVCGGIAYTDMIRKKMLLQNRVQKLGQDDLDEFRDYARSMAGVASSYL